MHFLYNYAHWYRIPQLKHVATLYLFFDNVYIRVARI